MEQDLIILGTFSAGGRDYNNYPLFKVIVDDYIKEIGSPNFIVSGGAKGVDTLAENYALENKIAMKIYKPEPTLRCT